MANFSIMTTGILFPSNNERKTMIIYILDVMAVLAQITALVVWPLMVNDTNLWLIPISITLISFRWWENYISSNGTTMLHRRINTLKENLFESRYNMYVLISPWKAVLFLVMAITLTGHNIGDYFNMFLNGWRQHSIKIEQVCINKI